MELKDSALYGGWQQPVNVWKSAPGSIHNDDTAKKVGMRGGTIPGTRHLNHFTAVIDELWGPRWYARGNISMYYTYASTDREDVRAIVNVGGGSPRSAGDAQFDVSVEHKKSGRAICKGSIGVGAPKAMSYVKGLEYENSPREQLRILADVHKGSELPGLYTKGGQPEVNIGKVATGKGELEGCVRHPANIVQMLMPAYATPIRKSVGFFGATDLQILDGPIRADRKYQTTGRVTCVGESGRTEYYWTDSELTDLATGKRVAEMRFLHRFMKRSAPVYKDQQKQLAERAAAKL